MSEFKVGSKVNLTLNGEVIKVQESGNLVIEIVERFEFDGRDVFLIDPEEVNVSSVPEQFLPGDRVRGKFSSLEFTIIDSNRYFSHSIGEVLEDHFTEWTSDHFELLYRPDM